MTGAAILSNRIAILGGVRAVMTSEAARKIHMPEVIGISSPGNLQIREDIAIVDSQNGISGLLYVLAPLFVQLGIVGLVEID